MEFYFIMKEDETGFCIVEEARWKLLDDEIHEQAFGTGNYWIIWLDDDTDEFYPIEKHRRYQKALRRFPEVIKEYVEETDTE